MVKKVVQYREAANYLCHTARKIAVTRNMRFVLVRLPQSAFDKSSVKLSSRDFTSTLARLNLTNKQRQRLGEVWQSVGRDRISVSNSWVGQGNRTMAEGKIHAEVQLIYHFESTRPQRLPRVICSSKDACFLCSHFISVYGKAYIPRGHGKLYPAWRLPPFARSSELEQHFNQWLEDRIKQAMATILQQQKKIGLPYPAESTVSTLPSSESSVDSLVHAGDFPVEDVNTEGNLGSYLSSWLVSVEQLASDEQHPADSSSDRPPAVTQKAKQWWLKLRLAVRNRLSSLKARCWRLIVMLNHGAVAVGRFVANLSG
ncbi:hypothetical protein CDD83_9760 [Cordyceps sp. RAO-2017]|nr:hypothetical protein CDD83_9760 [Cordyceps sp. RAO-2017]